MKAAILNGYSKNGCDLEIRDIPIPEVADHEVLVKIRTAGVNPLDNMIVHGEVKLIVPYSFPLVMGNFPMKKPPAFLLQHLRRYRLLN